MLKFESVGETFRKIRLFWIFFSSLRKRAIIETVNDELKNIAQVEHSRHRCFENFVVNMLGAIAAYGFFPKKPCIHVERTFDNQLTLF